MTEGAGCRRIIVINDQFSVNSDESISFAKEAGSFSVVDHLQAKHRFERLEIPVVVQQ
jgi:hypothetical protein